MPQSPSKEAPWDLTQFLQLPTTAHHVFLNLINSLKSLPFKDDFSFGKSQKLQGTKSRL